MNKIPAVYVVIGDRVRCADGQVRRVTGKTRLNGDGPVELTFHDNTTLMVKVSEMLSVDPR